MKTINEIIELFKNEKYDEAEVTLHELRRDDPKNPRINYLLGCLYDDYSNPKRSDDKAKRYFRVAAASDRPPEDAFCSLARLERNRQHAKRILFKGLKLFPHSTKLYERLLVSVANQERNSIFTEMCNKGIESEFALRLMAHTCFELGEFDKARSLIEKAQQPDEPTALTLRLFKGLCLLEQRSEEKALNEFSALIEQDVNQVLEYAPYFASIIAFLRGKPAKVKEAIDVFAQVPSDFEFCEPFLPIEWPPTIDYLRYILEATNLLLKFTRRKEVISKSRGIRSLCVFASEGFRYYSRTKVYKDLLYAHSTAPDVARYTEVLLEISAEKGDAFGVYQLSIDLLSHIYGKELEEKAEGLDLSSLRTCSEETFQRIVANLRNRLKSNSYQNVQEIAAGVFNPIVERLHKERKYELVRELVDLLGDYYVKKTKVLFEAAYALNEGNNKKRAATLYELLLQQKGPSSSILNNLAIIRESFGELKQAERLLNKARELEPEDKLVRGNLERVVSLRKAADGFASASFRTKGALLRLWAIRDIEDRISLARDKLSDQLGMSSEEASVTLKSLIDEKVLLPIYERGGARKTKMFRLNPGVHRCIAEVEKEVEERSPIMEIASDITSNGLVRVGYNKEIKQLLCKITSVDLRHSLDRDLREAAFALLTRSFKTTLIMCGSIIESVLLDKLLSRGIKAYKCSDGKTRTVNRMSLGDLPHVSFREKVIEEQLYHLAHALRGFRNLIHPGIEQRTQAMIVSENNARIAWDITRKLLNEI
jgi:tetratricopeptide (TPR) repeat protein